MTHRADIEKLIRNHTLRLQDLKEQRNRANQSDDAKLIEAIESIETKLVALRAELGHAEADARPDPVTHFYPTDAALRLLGRKLGRFELAEVVGQGSLATVYKAYQPNLERWVALKVLHVYDDTMLARFEREAKAIARVRHPNILVVMEYNHDDGWSYIVMEYVEGGTLASYLQGKALQGKSLDWTEAVRLVIPIAEALHDAHQHGLIHRDVKPSNIMMRSHDWPLLADFGMVRLPDPKVPLTESDVVMGTPAYVPPEQARAETIDGRADMYSLGVVLFEMITGRLPFLHKNPTRQVLAHLGDPPPAPRDLNPDCPPQLEAIILKTMQKSPHDRYADMPALIGALNETLRLSSTSSRQAAQRFPGTRPLTWPGSSSAVTPLNPPIRKPAQPSTARLVIVEKNVTIELPEPAPGKNSLIIGRSHGHSRTDIDLGPHGAEASGISRRHARLIRQGQTWLIDDLGSLNGTYLNDVKLYPGSPVPLTNNDVIRCSKLSLVFVTSPQD